MTKYGGEFQSNQDDNKLSTTKKLKQIMRNPLNWVLGFHQFGCGTIQYAFNGLWLINYMRLKFDIDRETSTMISNTFWISQAVGYFVIGKLAKVYKKRKIFYLL